MLQQKEQRVRPYHFYVLPISRERKKVAFQPYRTNRYHWRSTRLKLTRHCANILLRTMLWRFYSIPRSALSKACKSVLFLYSESYTGIRQVSLLFAISIYQVSSIVKGGKQKKSNFFRKTGGWRAENTRKPGGNRRRSKESGLITRLPRNLLAWTETRGERSYRKWIKTS